LFKGEIGEGKGKEGVTDFIGTVGWSQEEGVVA